MYCIGKATHKKATQSVNRGSKNFIVQWNLSIMVTLGPDISGLYIQVAVIEKTCIRWSAAF